LEELACSIGGDCPFFIRNNPCFVSGKGNLLQDISLKLEGYWLLLVFPGIIISTQAAYQEVTPVSGSESLHDLIQQPVGHWKACIKNQFEDSIMRKYPLLLEIKEELYKMGAVYASMSGSGSGLYGIFNSEIKIPAKFNSFFIYKEYLGSKVFN
jgi:4-diphosphocytidyl-2-C-methyl-D-erythritol kinase